MDDRNDMMGFSVDSSHTELKRLHAEAKKLTEHRKKLYFRRQLTDMLNKKFKTTMIGALASFEDLFGQLWGYGKEIKDLNSEELYWRSIWERVRTDILNKGNSQLRAALEEVNNYDLSWKKYRIHSVVKQDNKEQNYE